MAKTHITMKVNGAEVEGLVEPRTLLVHFIRENLAMTGTHIGCETTHCGACTVDIDGMSVKSCTMFAVQAQGSEIMTIEGVSNAVGAAGRFSDDARPAMRLLHARHDFARAPSAPGEPVTDGGGNPDGHFRQYLPLHRLPEHR